MEKYYLLLHYLTTPVTPQNNFDGLLVNILGKVLTLFISRLTFVHNSKQ